MHDEYLQTYFGDYLSTYEARCSKRSGMTAREIFHDLHDDDLWNLLLTREYNGYAAIKEALPDLPPVQLQRAWTGNCGAELSFQSCAFYKKVKDIFSHLTSKPLSSAKVLDFGCGWGRLIRYFAKDVAVEHLYGCDPDASILQLCLTLRVPGVLRPSAYRPKQLPFDVKFDLIYAYSVFTHLSETVHWECLKAIHDALTPGGIVVLTVRPRSFIEIRGIELAKVSEEAANAMVRRFDAGQFVFVPYNLAPIDGEVTYGDAAIPYAYVRRQWTEMFDLIGTLVFREDPYQVPIILRRRCSPGIPK